MLLDHHIALRWVEICKRWAFWATMALVIASGLQYAWIAARRGGANGHSANGHSAQ
jgi:hypothetical protein